MKQILEYHGIEVMETDKHGTSAFLGKTKKGKIYKLFINKDHYTFTLIINKKTKATRCKILKAIEIIKEN